MSHHIRRTVRILSMLSSGNAFTTAEIALRVSALEDDKEVSIRQIQRDLRTMTEAGVPLVESRDGRSIRWSMPSGSRMLQPLSINSGELLSLHILKGALTSFRGTRVEHDVDRLMRKLEKIAPGTVFMREDLVSDVSPGRYATAVNDAVLVDIVEAIVDPHWDRVTYRSIHASTVKTFVVSFCRLINHAGRLYVAAWHPVHNRYITLAADRIDHVKRASDITDPIHIFNEKRYRSGRFGVYDGDVTSIKLSINKQAAQFFTSRMWHPSQEFSELSNGNVTMTLHAPLSPELISWIVSWADVLTIISPKKLKEACRSKVASLL